MTGRTGALLRANFVNVLPEERGLSLEGTVVGIGALCLGEDSHMLLLGSAFRDIYQIWASGQSNGVRKLGGLYDDSDIVMQ